MTGEPGKLLRTPTGLTGRLNDGDELECFDAWRRISGKQVHEAMAADTHYDRQRMAFIDRKPFQYVFSDDNVKFRVNSRSDLKDVLDTCQEAGEKFAFFDVSTCEWSDVIEEMEKAEKVYKAIGNKNPIRGFSRHGQSISTTVVPLLNIIPDQMGLNILRAGLAMIFQAVQQREANREKIFEVFKKIPEIIGKAQTMREHHPKERELQDCTIELYIILLEELPKLIKILLRKHNAIFFKRWGRQLPGQEQNLISASIAKVDEGYADLKRCLDNITHKKLASIEQNVTNNVRETKAIRQTAVSTHVQVASVSKDLTMVCHNLEAHHEESKIHLQEVEAEVKSHITRNLDERREEMKDSFEEIKHEVAEMKRLFALSQSNAAATVSPSHAAVIQTGVFYIVLEAAYHQGYTQAQTYCSPTQTYKEVSTSDLLEILGVPVALSNDDLSFVLRQNNSVKTDVLGRGRWLMMTVAFKAWLGGGSSDLLLVDGHCDTGKISPISVFSASFVAYMIKLESKIVLHFFCGQHAASGDPFRGPRGLLRSLICQLLLHSNMVEPKLQIPNQSKLLEDLRFLELSALCHVFEQLIQQVPRGIIVFCIIDGISTYETRIDNLSEELSAVIDVLQAIVTNQNSGGPSVKVLLTSANKSTHIVSRISRHQHVSLRAGNVYNGPISEHLFSMEISKGQSLTESNMVGLSGQPWTESHVRLDQSPWHMSRLRIEDTSVIPQQFPWVIPQRVQTPADSERHPSQALRWNTQTPPENYPHHD